MRRQRRRAPERSRNAPAETAHANRRRFERASGRIALMFTGIIQATGHVNRVEPREGDLRLALGVPDFASMNVARGDSIAVSGCCLTVVEHAGDTLAFDVSNETLALTTLGGLRVGDRVNLERALRLSDGLDGHLVSGHVDGVGSLIRSEPDARSQRWTVELPPALTRYVAVKGSIAVDGVSLTVNAVDGTRFGVNLVPHTVAMTTFGDRMPGDRLNLEVDLVARYLERLLTHQGVAAAMPGATAGHLAQGGRA